MKRIMTTAFIIATIALGAQTNKMKKACIKTEKNENGIVTKIETCVTAATDEELQQKLNALGFGDMPEIPAIPEVPGVPPVPPVPPFLPTDEKEVTCTKVVIIDDGEAEGNGRENKSGSSYSFSSDGDSGGDAQVIVMDGEGNTMKTSPDKGSVVIKKLKPGEKMDTEVERIMNEHRIDPKDGESYKIIIRNNENKNGKENKDVKVYVFNKGEVKDLSAEYKKQLPAGAYKAIQNAKPFDELTVAPNPTDDACKISYKSSSKEALQINVYDMEGKTVYTETDKNVSDQISKAISLKELGKGIYFVHLTQGKQSEVRKVIVK